MPRPLMSSVVSKTEKARPTARLPTTLMPAAKSKRPPLPEERSTSSVPVSSNFVTVKLVASCRSVNWPPPLIATKPLSADAVHCAWALAGTRTPMPMSQIVSRVVVISPHRFM